MLLLINTKRKWGCLRTYKKYCRESYSPIFEIFTADTKIQTGVFPFFFVRFSSVNKIFKRGKSTWNSPAESFYQLLPFWYSWHNKFYGSQKYIPFGHKKFYRPAPLLDGPLAETSSRRVQLKYLNRPDIYIKPCCKRFTAAWKPRL